MNKHLKKLIALLLMMVVSATMFSSLALWGYLYVNRDKVNVYAEDNTDSKVIKTYKGGKKLAIDALSPNGKWAQITVGSKLGFVQKKYLSEKTPQKYCKHEWGKWKVQKEPTCTQKGYSYRICKICELRDEKETKKLGHDWGNWKVIKEATCTEEGKRTRTCKRCGEKESENYLAEHTYGSWKVTVEPTCTKTGERVRKCKVCGKKETQTLDKLPHDYEYRVTVEATDHSAGVRSKVCKVCGHVGGEESFDPAGTLRRGDKGEEVRAIQQLLVEQNYLNAGGADGVFGGGTEKALIKYQQDRNLNPDGIAWPQTINDLQHDYGPWETVKEMTRTEAGERVRVCRGCGFEQRETIEPGTVFERGRRGDDIRALQQMIKQVGYDAGSVDGIYGKKLDAAMAKFAADKGITVVEGKIRPGDVDAVVNAWLELQADDTWKGESSAESPVNLALTVTQNGKADDSGITNYSWSLTNLGTENAMFNALLLSFGETPDYRDDVMVMALDGYELKADGKNTVSGSFYADGDWGKGNLNFAAMAISDKTGAKWLSNTVAFENEASLEFRTVAPVENPVDVNNLPDGIYPVSFDRGDVLNGSSGIYMNGVHIYTQDWYDIVDVNSLKEGDVIIVEGEEVPVLSVENTEYGVSVNEDKDARSFYLASEEDTNGFFIRGLDDMTTYTDQGVTTLVVDPAATFTDAWDIEKEPVTVNADGIVEAMQSSENEHFVQYNTTVRIENGRVVEINRTYVP